MTFDFGHVVRHLAPDHAVLRLSRRIYDMSTIFRTCYKFTDRYYIYLSPDGNDDLLIFLKPKDLPCSPEVLTGAFTNDLIDQQLRTEIARETGGVRELIVAQAFAEGNLLLDSQQDADAAADPRKISEHQ